VSMDGSKPVVLFFYAKAAPATNSTFLSQQISTSY